MCVNIYLYMTIREIEKLNYDEDCKHLRLPNSLNGITRDELYQKHLFFKLIVDDVIRNTDRERFLNSLFGKRKMKLTAHAKIKSHKSDVNYYTTTCDLGEGMFSDARKMFENEIYPQWIKHQYCFNNTHLYILKTKQKAKILSGISFVGKPFLHSVLLIDENIVDFNYDLVMSKDLYIKLTSFEILEVLDSKKLLENKDLIINNRKHLNLPGCVLNFAFDEVVERLKTQKEAMIAVKGV